MVGLGGGFILVPILRLAFAMGPAEAAGTSLCLVVANSASGAFTYFLQRRIDVRLGLAIAAGGFPGSIAGAITVNHLSARAFDWIFAAVLLIVAADMMLNRERRAGSRSDAAAAAARKPMSYRVALLLGLVVGFVSSLFGIGGGIVVVPSLLYFSTLPAHAISATSHFAIFLTSPVGLISHLAQHDVRVGSIAPLVIGGLLGGPVGAHLSARLKSHQLLMLVATAIVIAALAMIARHFVAI